MAQNTGTASGGGCRSNQCDRRHAHPQSIKGGGVAGVRKRVQSNVDAVIKRKILLLWETIDKFHSRQIDSVFSQEFLNVLAGFRAFALQQEKRARNSTQNAGPQQ